MNVLASDGRMAWVTSGPAAGLGQQLRDRLWPMLGSRVPPDERDLQWLDPPGTASSRSLDGSSDPLPVATPPKYQHDGLGASGCPAARDRTKGLTVPVAGRRVTRGVGMPVAEVCDEAILFLIHTGDFASLPGVVGLERGG